MVGRVLLPLTPLLLSSAASAGSPALAPVFQDAMGLQRGIPVPVWDRCRRSPVTVKMADQRKRTKADDKGK